MVTITSTGGFGNIFLDGSLMYRTIEPHIYSSISFHQENDVTTIRSEVTMEDHRQPILQNVCHDKKIRIETEIVGYRLDPGLDHRIQHLYICDEFDFHEEVNISASDITTLTE